ncbi:LysE family translocator [Deinococcus koreensis]|uniref:RhtB family transporter n=1 Tax=Deinococcus koreensis TaxID=2054903 RepID=A0A2K3UWN6_9DEIO|nr:LysE family translocator [Deinococcus koreensis]PNY80940.1 RhtB family transporter [Deinococcus koreensis]
MPDLSTLLTFSAAALALLLVPGPSVLYIVARSLQGGRRSGLVSALGVQTGGLVHVLAATVGVSALVMSSALLFTALKVVGAGYLIYLGVRTLLGRDGSAELPTPPAQPLGRVFLQGALVNALNPKTALFFLAFLPQFVNPARGPVAPQTLALGALFLALATLSDGTYALLAGSVGRRLQGNRVFARRQKYVTGGVYIALGVGTATVGHG